MNFRGPNYCRFFQSSLFNFTHKSHKPLRQTIWIFGVQIIVGSFNQACLILHTNLIAIFPITEMTKSKRNKTSLHKVLVGEEIVILS